MDTSMAKYDVPVLEKEDELIPEMSIFICENTDCVLDPMEQMTYALNETQVRYGSVIVLKNAP
ncbi:MAG: hypothetical protein WAM27_10595 [Nitrososphaeraceae archaeon]|jgi:hypothetical protein